MGELASDPVSDGFFRTMAERYVEKTADKAVAKRPRLGGEQGKDRSGLNPLLLLAQPAAQAFDAYSTGKAMEGGGAREGNPAVAPIAGKSAALMATKVGLGIGTALASQLLAKKGHRTLAKIFAGIGIAEPTAMGIHNMEMTGRSR